jgi:hypothetical protein
MTSSGSGFGSDFRQFTVSVPVPVPVQAPYLDNKKHSLKRKIWIKSCLFTWKAFLQGKKSISIIKFIHFIVKCE